VHFHKCTPGGFRASEASKLDSPLLPFRIVTSASRLSEFDSSPSTALIGNDPTSTLIACYLLSSTLSRQSSGIDLKKKPKSICHFPSPRYIFHRNISPWATRLYHIPPSHLAEYIKASRVQDSTSPSASAICKPYSTISQSSQLGSSAKMDYFHPTCIMYLYLGQHPKLFHTFIQKSRELKRGQYALFAYLSKFG
jgi:hypothetical protein